MKRITASEARRNWFQILDRVAAGEAVVIDRKGRRIVIQREDEPDAADVLPDYASLIRPVADVNRAADWSWEWTREGELHPGGGAGE